MTRVPSFIVMILGTSLVSAAEWPQGMGSNRDDIWDETGVIEKFPRDGLNAKPINGRDDERRSGANEGATFVTKNGDRFFIFGENGDLVIARLSLERYDEISRTRLLKPVGVGLGRSVVWSHPAYSDKCVFARNDQEIVCASLTAQ